MEKEKINEMVQTTDVNPATGEVVEATAADVTTPSGRDKVVERLRTYNPEGVYEDDEAIYGGIGSMLDENDARMSEMNGKIEDLAQVFKRSPQTASFFIDMMEGKGLYESLGRNFGQDMLDAMEGDEEARAEFDKGLAEWQAESDAREARNNTFKTNSDKSMSEYEAWLAEEGYSAEDRAELEADIMNISNAMGEGNFMDFVRALSRSRRYDRDVENARSEGEIRGRNARIAEERTLPKNGGDGLPSMQGLGRPEPKVKEQPQNGWRWDRK